MRVNKKIYLPLSIIVLIFLLTACSSGGNEYEQSSDYTNVKFPAFETSPLENRQSFSSVEEMKSSVLGTWKLEEGDIIYYYLISENEVDTFVSVPNGKDPVITKSMRIEWYPEQGCLISDTGNNEKAVVVVDKGAISLQNGMFHRTNETPYRKRNKSGYSKEVSSTNATGNPFVYYDHNGKQYTKSIKCPKCGTINRGKVDCEKCGYYILNSYKRCRNCGATVIDTNHKCPHCKEDKFDHY